jgi:hypothetical protein
MLMTRAQPAPPPRGDYDPPTQTRSVPLHDLLASVKRGPTWAKHCMMAQKVPCTSGTSPFAIESRLHMDPWYKVATPRKEVREGRSFNPACPRSADTVAKEGCLLVHLGRATCWQARPITEVNPPRSLSDQAHDAPLGIVAALDVALGRTQRRMAGQLLHILQRAAGLDDLLRQFGDEGASA